MPELPGKIKNDESDAEGTDSENCSEKAGRRAGLPDKNAVIEEKQFKSPKGRTYRILKTSETDEYDQSENALKNNRKK